jgi:hypothetical protein
MPAAGEESPLLPTSNTSTNGTAGTAVKASTAQVLTRNSKLLQSLLTVVCSSVSKVAVAVFNLLVA